MYYRKYVYQEIPLGFNVLNFPNCIFQTLLAYVMPNAYLYLLVRPPTLTLF